MSRRKTLLFVRAGGHSSGFACLLHRMLLRGMLDNAAGRRPSVVTVVEHIKVSGEGVWVVRVSQCARGSRPAAAGLTGAM